MTDKRTRPAGATHHGWLPDLTDPLYRSGWNVLSGKNLNLRSPAEPSRETPGGSKAQNDERRALEAAVREISEKILRETGWEYRWEAFCVEMRAIARFVRE